MSDAILPKRRSRREVVFRRLTALLIFALWCWFATWMSMPVRQRARVAQVRAEISILETGLASFRLKYGIDPPSSITLHSTKEAWEADRKSRDAIRQLWPEFDFKTCGGMSNVPANGVHLNGAECLVFFLGGISDPASGIPIGFSMNLTQPFAGGNGRKHPAYEFDRRRLVDLDQDGFREFLDSFPVQTKPFLYISSNDGQGYDPADFDGAMRDVYRTGSAPNAKPWKPKGFQIISPGTDHEYGIGGVYDPKSVELANDSGRKAEFDNVTNFAPGVLVQQPSSTIIEIEFGLAPLLGLLLLAALVGWCCWFTICRRR